MQVAEVLSRLRALSDPKTQATIMHSTHPPRTALGVNNAKLRKLAGEIGVDRLIAQQLWASGIHEARLLASLIDDPKRVTSKQMERWVRDFDTPDLCDACCLNLFVLTPFAFGKVATWSTRREELVKRASFVLLGCLAEANKVRDSEFNRFFAVIEREAGEERPLVKRAIAQALSLVARRSPALHKNALATADNVARQDSKNAQWVASEARKAIDKAPAPQQVKKKTAKKKAATLKK